MKIKGKKQAKNSIILVVDNHYNGHNGKAGCNESNISSE